MMKRIFQLFLSLICVMNPAFCSVPDSQLMGSLVENKSIKKVGKYLVQYIKGDGYTHVEVINFNYLYPKVDSSKVRNDENGFLEHARTLYGYYAVSDSVLSKIYDHIKKRDPHILKKFKPYADDIGVVIGFNNRGELCGLFFDFSCECDKKIRPINIVRLTKGFDGLKLRSPKKYFKYTGPPFGIVYGLRLIINRETR